jgi:sugar phosphate isomerase/epimerase
VPAADIVVMHGNDAVAGVPIDEHQDEVRMLPLATGVVPIVPILRRLQQSGYDGPVAPEPFNASLEHLAVRDPTAAARAAARTMRALGLAAGLQSDGGG